LPTLPCRKGSGKQPKNSLLCRSLDLGCVEFSSALTIQKKILQEVISCQSPDTLIFCQHPHTITLGRLSREDNILADKETLRRQGVKVLRIDRGGEVTYHGPGQMMVYPVFDLARHGKDLKKFLYNLEQVIIDFLRYFGINGERRKGLTGAWIGERKITSIGIGVRKWVTYHGLAINLTTDLEYFSLIRPCGMDVRMVSLQQVYRQRIDWQEAKAAMENCFAGVFNLAFGGKSHD
jgi:lipoate-protein ligase B